MQDSEVVSPVNVLRKIKRMGDVMRKNDEIRIAQQMLHVTLASCEKVVNT